MFYLRQENYDPKYPKFRVMKSQPEFWLQNYILYESLSTILDSTLLYPKYKHIFLLDDQRFAFFSYDIKFTSEKKLTLNDIQSLVQEKLALAEKQTKEPTTEKVTEKIAELPTEAVTPFEIVNYSSEVAAGSNANIKIKGKPNTEYTIDVVYNSGSSKAEGLEPKISDSYGNVSWEWEVGTKTTPGTYSITVNGGGTFKSVKFTVFNNN